MIDMIAMGLACLAHRAQYANPTADEETRPAVQVAFDQGCDVELDIHNTKDGVPVLQHDPTLDRTLGQPGVVHDYTAAEYLTFRTIPNAQKPLTYAAALGILANYPDRHMTFEVWDGWWTTARLAALQSAAVDAGVADRVTLYCGDRTRLATIHAAAPLMRLGIKGLPSDALPSSVASYITTVFINSDVTPSQVAAWHASGRWVVAAQALTSTDFDAIAATGADQVSTNKTKAWQKWSAQQ